MADEKQLPFDVTARVVERGLCVFIASVDGRRITSERYTPGDGSNRRKVAKLWAEDKRLCNREAVEPAHIANALESVELAAMEKIDQVANDAAEPIEVTERASWADNELLAELTFNLDTARADFIVQKRNTREVERHERVETSGGVIVVPSICAGIVTPGSPFEGTVFVPSECDPAGENEQELRGKVADFINRYVELPGDSVPIAVEYVLLTWIYDAFDEVPYLAFRTADLGRGKSRALETIGAICYRPLFCGGGSSAAAVLRMLDVFGGTLVADEFDHTHNSELASDLNRILNQGFQRGRPLVKCEGDNNAPRVFRCFGPKLFALRSRLGDDATESRTLSIRMTQRTRGDIPINLPRRRFDGEACQIRNRLLAWRFANHGKITINPSLADPGLEDRANQIGLPLLAVARSDEARNRIVVALKEQQGAVAADRADSLAGEVFAAILAIKAANEIEIIRPGDVAAEVNRRRAKQAKIEVEKLGRRTVSPQRVGRTIGHELELPRDVPPRDNAGARYRLDPHRVTLLCRRFGEPLPETSQMSHRHRQEETSPENGVFDTASGDCDVSDDSDVSQGAAGGASREPIPTDSGCSPWIEPERDENGETAVERAARLRREAGIG